MSQDSPTIDAELSKTDMGKTIKRNKQMLIGSAIGLIVIVFAVNFYLKKQKADKNEALNSLYEFRTTKFEEFKTGKLGYDAFAKELDAFNNKLISSPLALSLVSDMASVLAEKEKKDKATEILENLKGNLNATELSFALVSFKLVSLYENQNLFDKAVTTLESVLKAGHKDLENKVYFDLARNYFYLKDTAKAKKNFNYVIEKFEDSEYAKMSKLYLGKL